MSEAAPHAFLAGHSRMAGLMRAHDWSASPLGAPAQWPQSLRSVVNLMLGSAFPMFVAWGPELAQLYNDAYIDVMGAKHPRGIGRPLLENWAEIADEIGPLAEQALRGDSRYVENLPLRMRRGRGLDEDTWFTFSYSPVQDDRGVVAGMFCACIETTQTVLAERALRNADRQKDEFLATLAHELRNPLAPIRTASHLLGSPGAEPAAKARAAEIIARQVGQMSRLLDDLVDISRITQRRLQLRKARVPVGALVDAALEAARPLAQAKGHTLDTRVDDAAATLVADPVRLTQVLSNLLNNACKYTDPGGRIALAAQVGDDAAVFTVTDSGIGLLPSTIDNLFVMFAQEDSAIDRAEGGLGIGLALCKGLVELHGGTIAASSEGLGHGSCFVVRLPHDAASAAPALSAPGAAVAVPAEGLSILLADDNRDAVEALGDLLELDGHRVTLAHDGAQAAEMALRLQPEVVVLDIGMPGLNGYEVARRVREQPWGRHALLIAATGWGQAEDRQRAHDAGFDHHFTKPFDPAQFARLLARHGAGPERA